MVAEGLPAQLACRVLDVSESGFYAWRARPPSERAIRHAWLTDLIRQIHADFRGVYGYRRVHAELTLGHGLAVGEEAVWLLMRKAGLQGLSGRPAYRRIPNQPTAGDLVDRNFARSEPDRLWVTDITEHPTREGKVYCAVVLDVFSRRVVGWSIDSTQNAALVTNALGMAIGQRNPTGETVIHSDQGTQGGVNRSSQHLDRGGVRWERCGSGRGRSSSIGARCRRRGGRRWRGVRIGSGSGRRSLEG
jgi:putative transposase